jgi:hypothetical protein
LCWVVFCFFGFFSFCTVAWTQVLHLEPLHQPFIVKGFFWDRASRTVFSGWSLNCDPTDLFLQICRITGMPLVLGSRSFLILSFLGEWGTRLFSPYLFDQEEIHICHVGIQTAPSFLPLPLLHSFLFLLSSSKSDH